MAILIVNENPVEARWQPDTPPDATAQFVAEHYGERTTYRVERTEAEQTAQRKQRIRADIAEHVGDSDSLIGVLADAVHVLLAFNAELAAAINQTTSKEAAPIRAILADWQPMMSTFGAGRTSLPFDAKGRDATMADIAKRAAATADVLNAHAQNAHPSNPQTPTAKRSKTAQTRLL